VGTQADKMRQKITYSKKKYEPEIKRLGKAFSILAQSFTKRKNITKKQRAT
jgi:hypothetical protein